jgi:hypothetical protein
MQPRTILFNLRIAHRRMNTYIGGDTRQNDIDNAFGTQNQIQIRA